ncbi:MAG TPA: T9SS type A sorting domain-containing protein [Chitinophagaceae bacterium]|nr:T9SS type A sorting domain-containing protein [Chitinophagaceae bacterium]
MKSQALRSYVATAMLVLCSLFFSFSTVRAQTFTPRYVEIASNIHGFYEYLPAGYNTSSETYPLLIFVHGMGEMGDGSPSQLPKVLVNGVPKLIKDGKFPQSFTVNGQTHKFIVLAPQMQNSSVVDVTLNMLIDYAIAHYRVNPNRIYATGLSLGGGFVWKLAGIKATSAQRLAAIVPMCGAATFYTNMANNIGNSNLPVWAFHNEGDPTVSVNTSRSWVNGINLTTVTPKAKLTVFPVSGHDCWTKASDPNYRENGLNMYEWMLSYSRGTTNAPPVVNAGSDKAIVLPTSSVQLSGSASDPDGTIASYTWSKVSGPTSYSFSNAAISNPVVSALVAGSYVFKLTVKDNKGATASDNVTVTVTSPVTTTPPPSTTDPGGAKYIKVKVYGGSGAYSNTEWNNWNVGAGTVSNVTSAKLKYSDATASNVAVSLSHSTGVGDNGTSYGSGMAPAEVLRHSSYSNMTVRTLTITGLQPSKKYDIELYASRSNNPDNTTTFSIGSLSKAIVTYNNKTNKAAFTGLTPSSSGVIVISLKRSKLYTYLNGFVITEGSTSTTTAAATKTPESTSAALEVYPNPFSDRVMVKMNNDYVGKFSVTITNQAGAVVKQISLNKAAKGLSQQYISLGSLPKGNYVLTTKTKDSEESVSVIKL